ncbi:MAG TPA: GxxExxY protein [Terriglobales bacterium]|nr:GxxExxY protein [Terriglobales bacterium]
MNTDKHGLLQEELTDKIIGVFYEVFNELGHGFLESVYEQAMFKALTQAGLKVERQVPIPVWFRGEQIGDFRADLLIDGKVLVELKAVHNLDSTHEAQVLNYLRATTIEVGLLRNFGPRPQLRRLLFTNDRKNIRVHPCESVAKGS